MTELNQTVEQEEICQIKNIYAEMLKDIPPDPWWVRIGRKLMGIKDVNIPVFDEILEVDE